MNEMFSTVAPILAKKDEERKARIEAMTSEVRDASGKLIERRLETSDTGTLQELFGHIRKMRRADMVFRESMVVSLVTRFDVFLVDVLQVCYRQNPGWLKNPEKKISYKELLEIGSLDAFKEELINRETESLMRDSHHEQVKFIDERLKLGIEANFPDWKKFIEVTERRNLFVHTGGQISTAYLSNCKKHGVTLDSKLKENMTLRASDEYISDAADCFYELSVRISQAACRRLFPDSFESADRRLNNDGVELMQAGRWNLALRIFEFALSIPTELKSRGDIPYYFLINLCIAQKFSGADFRKRLYTVDWEPFHPKYHFALAVLEDNFSKATTLLRSEAVKHEVTEKNLREWPLLREFRKTQDFREIFKERFGKDYDAVTLSEAQKKIEDDPPAGGASNPNRENSA